MQSRYFTSYSSKKFFMQILFFSGMGILFCAVIVLYCACFFVQTEELFVNRTFYFLVLTADERTVSVWAQDAYVSGGAGYAFSLNGRYYVGVASYRTEEEAKIVRDTLQKKGKTTEVLPLKVDTLYFHGRAEKDAKPAVESCVNTLLQCIDLLYNTANGVDTVQYTQQEARAIIAELKTVFGGLRENGAPQTEALLAAAVNRCTEMTSGIVYAKDIRYLQLFLSEGIYNLQNTFER